jgi:preprotein translocase subunit YajC
MGGAGFLLIILLFVVGYLVLMRPQKRRQQAAQQMLDNLQVGDEVVTAGGIYGEVQEIRDEDVLVEIAPALTVRVARRAIGGVVPREEDEQPEAEAEAAGPAETPPPEDGG